MAKQLQLTIGDQLREMVIRSLATIPRQRDDPDSYVTARVRLEQPPGGQPRGYPETEETQTGYVTLEFRPDGTVHWRST